MILFMKNKFCLIGMALIGFHLGSSAATNPFLNDSGGTPVLKQQQKVKKKKVKEMKRFRHLHMI